MKLLQNWKQEELNKSAKLGSASMTEAANRVRINNGQVGCFSFLNLKIIFRISCPLSTDLSIMIGAIR